MQNMNMKNKKIIVTSIIVAVLVVATLGATYAYFQASIGTGSSTSTKVTASTLDSLTFATGNAITLEANQTNFASGKTNITGTTSAKATLTSNDASNTSTEHYNLFLNISDNNFKYSVSESTPELLLTIKDGDNNEVTSITGLEHKTVTDGKGNQISGFDVTTKTGLITILNNKEITASPTKEETWNVTVTFVNYAKDQTGNENKSFEAQILITKDDFNSYSPNIINSLSVTRSSGSLTVKLNLNEGTDEIDKYYFAIKEKDSLAMTTNKKSKVMMLSNKTLAENSLTYVESSTNTHTFSNISDSGEYEIYAYAVDKKKLKTNTYNYSLTSSSYTLPVINSVTTTASDSSIKIDVSATKGSNTISKYYYSIDSGNTYVESTSNSYTFTGLKSGINYRIIVKVIDSNNKYSNIYVVNEKIAAKQTLVEYVVAQYSGTQGNNGIYYHDGSLENGISDNSYRYSGANPNNYVCFGFDVTSTNKCPTDNLYRIIGVIDGKVKLIKYDPTTNGAAGGEGVGSYAYVGENSEDDVNYDGYNKFSICYKGEYDAYYWNTSQAGNSTNSNDWDESNLNFVNLNSVFLYTFSDKWINKISRINWWKPGINYSNFGNYSDYQIKYLHRYETTGAISANDQYKLGLMDLADFYMASEPLAWEVTWGNWDSKIYANWMNRCMYEWTMVREIDEESGNHSAIGINNYGYGFNYCTVDSDYTFAIRPTFYLNTTVKYVSGSGTSSDPIIID